MSRNTKTKSSKTKVIPSCSHCRNLGLKFDHWLRQNSSHDSPILCPILLKTECRYCHQLGHNVSKCQRLIDSKKENTENTKKKEYTIHVELDKPNYASIAKQLLNILHKTPIEKVPYQPPSYWVPHGRLMDWTDDCDSSDDEI
jgi:hypothetical protein